MTKANREALQRADCAVAGALLLAAAVSAALVAIDNVPSKAEVAIDTSQAAYRASQFVRNSEGAAINAEGMFARSGGVAANIARAIPTSAMAASDAIVQPLRALTAPSPATEATIIRVLEDQRCLAEAMYYEARGEGRAGEEAIAEVIFHRMHALGYPRTICGVVYQGAAHRSGCQFSFTCDGERVQPKSGVAWSRARLLAAKIMAGIVHLGDVTENAISFHAADVQPDWADGMERTIQIGNHVFYRAVSRTKAS